MPEDGYGWEKLFTERMCRHFREDFGLTTRVARYHNVYGPHGTWTGGREKAPAAICRKVADGRAHRRPRDRDLGRRRADPQLHVHRRLRRGHPDDHRTATSPSRSTSAAPSWSRSTSSSTSSRRSPASRCERSYKLDAPQGVRGRNSDNTQIQDDLRLGALHLPAGRAGRRPTPGSTTRSKRSHRLSGGPSPSMRVLVHDYSGHPFQVELSSRAGPPRA